MIVQNWECFFLFLFFPHAVSRTSVSFDFFVFQEFFCSVLF